MLIIAGQQHSFFADEEVSVAPLGHLALCQLWWPFASVVPGQFYGWFFTARWILISHNQPDRRTFRIDRWTFRFGAQWSAELQRPMWQIHMMTSKICQCSATKRPPISPSKRQVFR